MLKTADELAAIIAAWACAKPSVLKAWGYGSRFGSQFKRPEPLPESDVDVALELRPGRTANAGLAEMLMDDWGAELTTQLGYPADLHERGGKIDQYIAEGGRLVFDRGETIGA
jgi:hypothetical protein